MLGFLQVVILFLGYIFCAPAVAAWTGGRKLLSEGGLLNTCVGVAYLAVSFAMLVALPIASLMEGYWGIPLIQALWFTVVFTSKDAITPLAAKSSRANPSAPVSTTPTVYLPSPSPDAQMVGQQHGPTAPGSDITEPTPQYFQLGNRYEDFRLGVGTIIEVTKTASGEVIKVEFPDKRVRKISFSNDQLWCE